MIANGYAGPKKWVEEMAALTRSDGVVWRDGSQEEWQRLPLQHVDAGTLIRLNPTKCLNSFYTRSVPSDVARIEGGEFILSKCPEDSDPITSYLNLAFGGLYILNSRNYPDLGETKYNDPPKAPLNIMGC